jgi:Tetracyclin repressor-like, C-terminal domain
VARAIRTCTSSIIWPSTTPTPASPAARTWREVRSLEAANRLAIVAKRDQYAARVRHIIERGCRSGRFSTRTPQIAAFAVLEMGNSAKSWFRPSGRYPDTFVASEYGEFALRVVGCV